MKVHLGILLLGVFSCGSPDPASPDDRPANVPPGTTAETPPLDEACFPGDIALVKATTLAVLGRRPLSRDEVDAHVAVLQSEGPEVLVALLASDPAYLDRWSALVMDHLRVQRSDLQSQIDCYGKSARPDDDGALAAWVRDHEADSTGDGSGPFTARDLLRSSLVLDDVVPALRGNLFAMMNVPVRSCNVYSGVIAELQRRDDFGRWFDSAYLNRDEACLSCHNSESSVTWSSIPELNRHWPLPGLFEASLFGQSHEMNPDEAHAMFRFDGVKECNFPNVCTVYRDGAGARTPWGWSAAACGDFYLDDIPPDATEITAHFGTLSGEVTVYDLDAALKRGTEALRTSGLVLGEGGELSDPDAAFAYLASAAFVEFVWEELVGTPLTIANHFPRNAASRDQLAALTDVFIASDYSLQALIAAIVQTPWFDPVQPSLGCGDAAYTLPNVYDPWVTSEFDAAMQLNSAADGIQPLSARTVLSATAAALGQDLDIAEFFVGGPYAPELLTAKDRQDTEFLAGIGTYLNHGATGFRGLDFQGRLLWEERFGSCPAAAEPDYIDGLLERAAARPESTVRDMVLALKDRFLAEPTIDAVAPDEAALLESIYGASLDAPASSVADLETATRRTCGVLLATPQFLLGGLATDESAVTPVLNVLD